MKRALALMGATMALVLVSVGSASAAGICTVGTPAYCPAPTATATGATNVSTTSATLNATVNSNSGGPGNWSISVNGSVVATGTLSDSATTVAVTGPASGLTPVTTYTYTVSVTNTGATSTSSATFTTVAPTPEPPTPPSDSPSTPPSNSPSQSPTDSPSQSPGTPSEAPTVTPPAVTSEEKKAAASDAAKAAGGDVTFSAQVGSAVVFAVDSAAPTKNGKISALAMTVDPGAKVEATGSVKLGNGRKLDLPPFKTTVGADGQLVVTVTLTSKQLKALKASGDGTISLKIQVTDQYGTHTKTVKVDVSAPKTAKKSKK